jgi:starch synthase
MKGAIVCADRVSTVSPTYAKEIKYPEHSEGLHYILRDNNYKLSGILNGIDYEYYNPEKDSATAFDFSAENLEGKTKNKLALQKETGLPERADVPMIAVITRLASHKGLDLVERIMESVVAERDVQLVVLGKGEEKYEEYFKYLDRKYPDKVKALIVYDRDLSKRIYAAADIFVMPSKSEPCGLAQMIASRYGAVPVTRETGGLYDSIKGYYEENGEIYGNGFTFANYSEAELRDRIIAALDLYNNTDKWSALVKKIMNIDFSWNISAKKYIELYDHMC